MYSMNLDKMAAAVRGIAAGPVAEFVDAQVADELVALRRLADAAEAAYLTRLRVFDSRGISESHAALSTRAWMRHEVHVAPVETSRAVKTARGLADLPVIEAALIAGRIRVPHAEAIVRAAKLLGTDVIAECQDALVEAASTDDPTRLRAALRGLGAAVDDPKATKRAEKRDEGRWLDLSATFDGAHVLDGVLGAEDGALVHTAIDSLAKPAGPNDERTPSQRRADALVELCRHALANGDTPSQGGEATHMVVVTDLATLEARTGGLGELADGTILRGETVRRLACDAKISRIITGPDSQPLDVGRTQRSATTAQRKALRLRDGGCVFPGCDRPPSWTDVHHVIPWAQGGSTDVDEMALLCRKHHTVVHEGGWTMITVAPGRFRFVDPHGVPVPADPIPSTTSTVVNLVNAAGAPPRAGPAASGSAGGSSGSSGSSSSAGGSSSVNDQPGVDADTGGTWTVETAPAEAESATTQPDPPADTTGTADDTGTADAA